MLKVAVLGASGMLGREVVKRLENPVCLPRHRCDVTSKSNLLRVLKGVDAVINCAGVIPEKCFDNEDMIQVNALAPHMLAKVFDGHIVYVSTDCVFNGQDGPYRSFDAPNSFELYGMTKAVGEVYENHVTNVRTSFVGGRGGLLQWFFRQTVYSPVRSDQVPGWTCAFWSGSSVQVVADALCSIAQGQPQGLVHLATDKPISKFDLLLFAKEILGFTVKVVPMPAPVINRALVPTNIIPSILTRPQDIEEAYEVWRKCS